MYVKRDETPGWVDGDAKSMMLLHPGQTLASQDWAPMVSQESVQTALQMSVLTESRGQVEQQKLLQTVSLE
jgi:hypothetical protein